MPRLALTAALTAALAAGPSAAQSWTQFQGNAQHTGAVPAAAGAAISRVWSVAPAALGMTTFNPGVVSDGGRVFLSGDAGPSADSNYRDQRLVALTAGTGATNWTYSRPSYGWESSIPSVGDGAVYYNVTGNSFSVTLATYPRLVGVDAASGAERFAATYTGQWGNSSRPTVAGGQVLSMGGSFGGVLAGYDGVTGARQFQTAQMSSQEHQVVAVDATRAYLYVPLVGAGGPGTQFRGTLYAADRSSGAVQPLYENILDNYAVPYQAGRLQNVVLGGRSDALFMATSSYGRQVLSVDLGPSGGLRWRATVNLTGPMAVGNSRVYLPADNRLAVLDQATGAEVWSWSAPAGESLTNNALLTSDLVFVSSAGHTYAIDLSTHQAVWSVADGGTLSLVGQTLFIADANSVTAYLVPVPEPAGLLAAAAGVGLAGWRVRRRAVG